jgi:hypothetical protein
MVQILLLLGLNICILTARGSVTLLLRRFKQLIMIIISIIILVGAEGSLVLKFAYRFDDYIVTTSVVRGLDEGDNTTGIP